jgi:peptidoglycan/LPS O-acetylase OafA/YrhL
MRAIAVFCVVIVHCWGAAGSPSFPLSEVIAHMNLGVAIFFLLSGFLLYRPFIAHRAGGAAPPEFGAYARRRCLRILPAWWLVVTALVLIPSIDATHGSVVSLYALTFTLDPSGGYGCTSCGLPQTWSLAVEASFYLCLPLLVILTGWVSARWQRGWPRNELVLLAMIGVGGTLLNFAVFESPAPVVIGGTAISFALWFVLGMMLAVASAYTEAGAARRAVAMVRKRPGLNWLAAGVVFVVTAAWLPSTSVLIDTGERLVAFIVFGVTSLLLLVPAVFDGGRGFPRRLVGNRCVAWLGLVSYGIFLWHVAVIHALDRWGPDLRFVPLLALTVAITVPIAAASYYLVERPLLRFKYQRIRRPGSGQRPAVAR